MIHALDLFGTLAFAISGAFRAVRHELDLLGVIVLATATGIGGGMVRDVLLGVNPPAALENQAYILICAGGGVLVFFAAPFLARRWNYLLAADAIGLSVFAAIGAARAEEAAAAPVTVMLMATITASGGGTIRDVLVAEIPAVLKSDFYATAALLGGALYVGLGLVGAPDGVRLPVTIGATLLLRAVAMRYRLQLPRVHSLPASPSELTEDAQHRHGTPRDHRGA